MNTRLRLILLIGLILTVFGLSIWGLRAAHQAETRTLLAGLQRERSELLNRILDLTGQPLQSFARDYSNWDEMLAYLTKRDPAWASVNIDASLANFGADAAWVLDVGAQPIYQAQRQTEAPQPAAPLTAPPPLDRLRAEPFLHFFHLHAGTLLEVRTGPIQPSADVRRTSPPQGWFVVARRWDENQLRLLRQVLESDVTLATSPPASTSVPATAGVVINQPLPGSDGRPVAWLSVHYHPETIALLQATNSDETLVLYGFGLAVFAAVAVGLARWVLRPLRQLEQSLASHSPAGLGGLTGQTDEFGRLARLVEASFAQQRQLAGEVEERRRVEQALRHSTELRIRLARDVHDGLIQSIYAAGLGLEEARRTLQTEPATAEQRLLATQKSLNDTIRDLRNFIGDLEPEDADRAGFASALRTLAATLQTLHPVRLQLDIADPAGRPLTPHEELHLLQFAREAISNAMRHSGAATLRVSFQIESGRRTLRIEDDGRGFDPGLVSAHGRGLRNLAVRAEELSAALHIESSPDRGTRITLALPPSSSP